MTSILTNSSAMVALQTLNSVNMNLQDTQGRVSSGLKIDSGKDNAAYFAISETMKGDSGMLDSVNDGLTSTKNSIATARSGAEAFLKLGQEFSERVAFAQGSGVDRGDVQKELTALVGRMNDVISQSTFNGDNLVAKKTAGTHTIASGISRDAKGTLSVTTMTFDSVDLETIAAAFGAVDIGNASTQKKASAALVATNAQLELATSAATTLGISEKAVESQQDFLGKLTDTIDQGVSAMVDAEMEEEAARLQALQTQQQLATQALSMANSAPQSLMSLFR